MANSAAPTTRSDFLNTLADIAKSERDMRPDFARMVDKLARHVPKGSFEAFCDRAHKLQGQAGPVTLDDLLDVLVDGNRVRLWGSALKFQSRAALETIADEILVRQEYHFQSTSNAPLVIDAGANIGLATYYVRRMCQAGRVICFEPNPDTFAVLKDNVDRNGWTNVELHNAAVWTKDGVSSFAAMADAPLAAALNPRNDDHVTDEIRVKTVDLRPFLQEPVGLLKMDIEGAEADVLETCADDLGLVENIFVEVHPVQGTAPSLLLRVLAVLETAGFCVHVSRSPWSEKAHANRPMMQAHRTYSLSVYGTRIVR